MPDLSISIVYNVAEMRANQLEEDLTASRDLAKRYHDMYMQEKEKNRELERSKSRMNTVKKDEEEQQKVKKPQDRAKSAKTSSELQKDPEETQDKKERPKTTGGSVPITDTDLQDDEALFKRHVEMIAESKAMRTTSPIRIPDVIRKSEVCCENVAP